MGAASDRVLLAKGARGELVRTLQMPLKELGLSPRYRPDVLSRKLALATGAGAVHGGTYVLRNWGLADLPA
jgi:hypothetical protein